MHFLPDVWVECDACGGTRYNPETLAVKYQGKTIADVLDMSVDEALELFANIPQDPPRSCRRLPTSAWATSRSARPAPTLSGGEAQRVKLAAELARPDTGRTLYLLDEPTTGLHFDDIRKLLDVLHRLVDLGNTVVVIEHNLDVIKTADWVIDLGPEAGDGRRRGRRRGDARGDRRGPPQPHREVPQGPARRRPLRRAPRFDPKAAAREALEAAKAKARRRPRRMPRPSAAKKGPKGKAAAADEPCRCPGPVGGRRPAMAHPRPRRPATAARPAGTAGSSS